MGAIQVYREYTRETPAKGEEKEHNSKYSRKLEKRELLIVTIHP